MILTPKNKRRIGHILNIVLSFPVIILLVMTGLVVYDNYRESNKERINERKEYRDNYY